MKMKPEHYEQLKAAIARTLSAADRDASERYKAAGHSPKRFRWDALHASGLRAGHAHNDSEWPVYDYLHDDQIDTGLRKAMREMGEQWGATK